MALVLEDTSTTSWPSAMSSALMAGMAFSKALNWSTGRDMPYQELGTQYEVAARMGGAISYLLARLNLSAGIGPVLTNADVSRLLEIGKRHTSLARQLGKSVTPYK